MTKVFRRELGATPAELRRSASASPGPEFAGDGATGQILSWRDIAMGGALEKP
jgi:hypothetical protein